MITKEEFLDYEAVRVSGVTNMWDTAVISGISDLDFETIREIRKNYVELAKKYLPVRHKEIQKRQS